MFHNILQRLLCILLPIYNSTFENHGIFYNINTLLIDTCAHDSRRFTLRHGAWSSLFIFMPDTLVVLNNCCFVIGFCLLFPISYFTEECYVLMFRPCQFYKHVVWNLVVWDHDSTSTHWLLFHQGITHNVFINYTNCAFGRVLLSDYAPAKVDHFVWRRSSKCRANIDCHWEPPQKVGISM